jgi:hypothetical protein
MPGGILPGFIKINKAFNQVPALFICIVRHAIFSHPGVTLPRCRLARDHVRAVAACAMLWPERAFCAWRISHFFSSVPRAPL